ncbi:LOW QUALITY PROTEIN: protein COFACTOR ASSEMBLY OF COMPLEX C SUBUNIT B CCB3, chloroplastic [Phoenix dactylifera]|uniref:LOW QUALITY PROTEIN: protein COFACTOR ASSEMBLY OF COMPLEX C SUBUNIT B CCB3, chloroplastic n=1 Tax=Phoenix dactylifera TaxID=42345 RepID=A0A8B8JA45_PHODC|nr:LOW QUALITY PROTEIN: protein COFACTOR ASSEMBLY OF COMPLEX C SUBUNIT B CCB3, chloroplastic [Phoenix dactylifera]
MVFTEGLRRSKLWRTSRKTSACCLFGTTTFSGIRSSFNAPAGPDLSRCLQTPELLIPQSLQTAISNYSQALVVADLDPSTVKLAIGITGPFFSAFGFLFVLRIVMSWYPKLPVGKFPYVIGIAPTEPLLRVTRKLIPPLGGVDVTPVVWFGLISFLNEILVGPQGLLVLLSQQV